MTIRKLLSLTCILLICFGSSSIGHSSELDEISSCRSIRKIEEHKIISFEEDDYAFIRRDDQFYVNTLSEIVILLLNKIHSVVGGQVEDNFQLIILDQSKSESVYYEISQINFNSLKLLNVPFKSTLLVYNKIHLMYNSFWIPKQCYHLPDYLSLKCNLHTIERTDFEIHITESSLPYTIILENSLHIKIQNIELSRGIMECYCIAERDSIEVFNPCSCSDLFNLLYVVTTVTSTDTDIFLKHGNGYFSKIVFKVWDVLTIFSVPRYLGSFNIPIYRPGVISHMLIYDPFFSEILTCWKIPYQPKDMEICCKPNQHKEMVLLTFPLPENASYFVNFKISHVNLVKSIKINTIDYHRIIKNACFSKISLCRETLSLNFRNYSKIASTDIFSSSEAKVTQKILSCFDGDLTIFCKAEETSLPIHHNVISYEAPVHVLYCYKIIGTVSGVTATLFVFGTILYIWRISKLKESHENIYIEPDDESEFHYVDDLITVVDNIKFDNIKKVHHYAVQ